MKVKTSNLDEKPKKVTPAQSFVELRSKILPLLIKQGYLTDEISHLEAKGEEFSNFFNQFEKSSLLSAILRDLEQSKIVTHLTGSHKWILTSPVGSEGQSVNIGINTALSVANTINSYREALQINGEFCDPLSVTEKDLANLVQICQNLSSSLAKGGSGEN